MEVKFSEFAISEIPKFKFQYRFSSSRVYRFFFSAQKSTCIMALIIGACFEEKIEKTHPKLIGYNILWILMMLCVVPYAPFTLTDYNQACIIVWSTNNWADICVLRCVAHEELPVKNKINLT